MFSNESFSTAETFDRIDISYSTFSHKNGSVSITGLDFANNTYEVKFVLEYKNEIGKTVTLESEVLTYEQTNQNPAPAPNPSAGCAFGSAQLMISVISLTAVLGLVFRKRH